MHNDLELTAISHTVLSYLVTIYGNHISIHSTASINIHAALIREVQTQAQDRPPQHNRKYHHSLFMHSSNSSAGAVTLKPKLKRASNEQPPQAKRRRRTVSSPPPERVYQHIGSPPSTPRKNTNSPLDTIQDKQSPVKLPTSAESWKWTFTKASVAPCFISDVLRLTDGKQKGAFPSILNGNKILSNRGCLSR